jgi:hypothetical protein
MGALEALEAMTRLILGCYTVPTLDVRSENFGGI